LDWTLAIDRNREALKRVLAALVAMAGLGDVLSSPLVGEDGSARRGGAEPPAEPGEGDSSPDRPTLPRHLHRAVLRLLRPAESAARRLVIVAARGLVVPPRIVSGPPPHKGEGKLPHAKSPSHLWGGVRGGGKIAAPRTFGFRLFDPPRRLLSLSKSRARPAARSVPRISLPGITNPFPIPPAPSPYDPIDTTRLALRLEALGRALDNLPRQARRFARWHAARVAAGAQNQEPRAAGAQNKQGRARRHWPLRLGRPPGQRPARCRRPAHEVHDILADLQWFACKALEPPDTS
jgi:hypothetical protein